MKTTYKALMGAMAGMALATNAFAADITGAGSTFVFPVLAKWAGTYKGISGNGINYQAIGSGGGIAQIKAKTVTFGATDKPLTSKELNASGLAQFPVVVGGIVPVVNLPGVGPGQLALDGPTLANIFMGRISRWDDPAIKKLNPGINLPARPIAVVHRSDGSGTTFQFATYLSRVSADWKNNVGADTAVDWPTGIGAKGNEGVAGNVAKLAGAIGYVEYAFSKQNHLAYTKMINKAGTRLSQLRRPSAMVRPAQTGSTQPRATTMCCSWIRPVRRLGRSLQRPSCWFTRIRRTRRLPRMRSNSSSGALRRAISLLSAWTMCRCRTMP